MAENNKNTHFGRAGEYYAMSQLLLRGWNVSVPVVDLGDDVLIIDDRDKVTHRLQIKSANATFVADATAVGTSDANRNKQPRIPIGRRLSADFTLSRKQLRVDPPGSQLFYFFLVRDSDAERWRFLVISRERIASLKVTLENPPESKRGPGRPRVSDEHATVDDWRLTIWLDEQHAYVGDIEVTEFLNRWPDELPEIKNGPGSKER